MEFSHVGQHCNEPTCRQQDFLPFICESCHQAFCRDHRTFEGHRCPRRPVSNTVITCPICKKGITRIPGEDENLTWERHSTSGECQTTEKLMCPVRRCNTRLSEVNCVECNRCHEVFCLKHRYEDSHECVHPIERRMTSMRPFECTRCTEGFAKSTELLSHFKAKHGRE